MSLRIRIVLSSAGVIVLLLLLLGYFGVSASRESTAQILAERLVLAEQVAFRVDSDLEQTIRQLRTVREKEYLKLCQGDAAAAADFLSDVKHLLPFETHYLCLIDERGSVMYSEPSNQQITGSNLSASPYIYPVLKSNQPLVSTVTFDQSIGSYVVYVVTPILKPQGQPSLLVAAALDLSCTAIQSLTSVSVVGKTGYVEIVDGNGLVLATGNQQNLLKESDHGGVFANLIQSHKTAVSTCHSCHNGAGSDSPSSDIITFAPLSKAPWGVVVRQPEAEALANTWLLQRRLYIFGLIALVFLLTLVWFASRSITAPINRLTIASRKIAQGSLDEPVDMPGKDEISVLAHSFDTMRTKLKDSTEKTKQRTRELEGLNAIALTICQSLDLDTILSGSLQRVMELIGMEIGGILLLDDRTKTLAYRVHNGLSDSSVKDSERLKIDHSIEGKVAKSGDPVILDNVSDEQTSVHPMLAAENVRAFVCFPLRSKDKIIGVLNLASRKPRNFTAVDRQLLYSIASQISIAIENARLYEEVRDKEKVLTELLKHSISAQEEERKRIARELHDETSQALTTLAIGLETIAKSPPTEIEQLQVLLKRNQELAIKTLDDVHRLILDLRPSILDDLGLVPAVEWYAKNRLEPKKVKVHIETSDIDRRPPPHIEVALFRIAQEAISNIAQHAKAEFASISLGFNPDFITLSVEDDGVGFDRSEVFSSNNGKRGLGLLGMKERVEVLGGKFQIQSEPGMGTQIAIEIPISWNGASNG
ncbi:MAG: GAF domain-containing protein [Dehalococcoidia bacterium]|nr:GAF domain-containing protein [Dehalococcoidia bacterium]